MKIKLLSLTLLLALYSYSFNVVITITSVPNYTNPLENVFVAGSFNNWSPSASNFQFTNNQNGTYTLIADLSGTVEFKFTKGDFLTVEKDINCNELANRSLTITQNSNYSFSIANWRDFCENENQHTATNNVEILTNNFSIPQFNTSRRIWLYLPPDYHSSNKNYKVLYMHDGQNLFDNYYSFSGEWGVDESLNILFNQGDEGAIVVGIDNGGANRINEYTPWSNPTYGGGFGEQYMDFIVNNLKPYIDMNYRTKSDRNNTALIGSSLGGLISFYGGLKHPTVFSKLGVFSPSFWFSNEIYPFINQSNLEQTLRMYFIAGSQESTNMVNDINAVISSLINNGQDEAQINKVIKADGQHAEWFWKREFPAAYKWLFQENNSLNIKEKDKFASILNIQNDLDVLTINLSCNSNFSFSINDLSGKKIIEQKNASKYIIDKNQFTNGIYFLNVNSDKTNQTIKLAF
jgi:predicted alpha/beta superfamily hydrolase